MVERLLQPLICGNFLFHDTVKGAQASQVIYSLVETGKANDLNILKYLEMLLTFTPEYNGHREVLDMLMPWSDQMKERCKI